MPLAERGGTVEPSVEVLRSEWELKGFRVSEEVCEVREWGRKLEWWATGDWNSTILGFDLDDFFLDRLPKRPSSYRFDSMSGGFCFF